MIFLRLRYMCVRFLYGIGSGFKIHFNDEEPLLRTRNCYHFTTKLNYSVLSLIYFDIIRTVAEAPFP